MWSYWMGAENGSGTALFWTLYFGGQNQKYKFYYLGLLLAIVHRLWVCTTVDAQICIVKKRFPVKKRSIIYLRHNFQASGKCHELILFKAALNSKVENLESGELYVGVEIFREASIDLADWDFCYKLAATVVLQSLGICIELNLTGKQSD